MSEKSWQFRHSRESDASIFAHTRLAIFQR